jgi:hypothetical protein
MKKFVETSKKTVTMAAAVALIIATAALVENLVRNLRSTNPPEVEQVETVAGDDQVTNDAQDNPPSANAPDSSPAPAQVSSTNASRTSVDNQRLQLVKSDVNMYTTQDKLLTIQVKPGCQGEGEARIAPGGKLVFRNDTCEIIALGKRTDS